MFSNIDILSFIRLPLNNYDPLFFFFLQFKLCILQQLGFCQLFNVIILWSWFVCRIKVQIHMFRDKCLGAIPLYLSRRKHCSQESLSKSNSLSSLKRICLLVWNISWLVLFLFEIEPWGGVSWRAWVKMLRFLFWLSNAFSNSLDSINLKILYTGQYKLEIKFKKYFWE